MKLTKENARVGQHVIMMYPEEHPSSYGTITGRKEHGIYITWTSGPVYGTYPTVGFFPFSFMHEYKHIFLIQEAHLIQGKLLKERHLFKNTRVVLNNKSGWIDSIFSWGIIVKFDNGDDTLLVRKDGQFWYRESAMSNVPSKVAPIRLEK